MTGLVRDLNPGPLAPKARIMPLDQRAICYPDWAQHVQLQLEFFHQYTMLLHRVIFWVAHQVNGNHWNGKIKDRVGLVRDLNPGPLAPEARIIPLDQRARSHNCGPTIRMQSSTGIHMLANGHPIV